MIRRTGIAWLLAAAMLALLPASRGIAAGGALPEPAAEIRLIETGAVQGTLMLPASVPPAGLVLLLPDRLGHDPRGALYADQLLGAGLAVFDLLAGGGDAPALAAALPAIAAEAHAGRLPIGAIGFGAGARTALRLGSALAARVLLYPGCAGLAPEDRRAGGPVLLLHGGADPANGHAACALLAAELARGGEVRRLVYPAAGYAWDYPAYGLGGPVALPCPSMPGRVAAAPWPELAAMSAAHAAGFLARALRGSARDPGPTLAQAAAADRPDPAAGAEVPACADRRG